MGFIFSIALFTYIVIICIPCISLAFFAFKKRTDKDHFWILSGIMLTISILLQAIYVYWPYIDTHSAHVWSLFYSIIIGWHSLLILIFTVFVSILSNRMPILRGISFGAALSPLIWLIIALSGWIPAVLGISLKY
jgi:hypothetical protein